MSWQILSTVELFEKSESGVISNRCSEPSSIFDVNGLDLVLLEGHIITNDHVISNAHPIHDGTSYNY